tara:strand:+ start:41 stop:301 length:261 start_codon:yes stop_codon:yes gene_type:complete
MKKNLKSTRKSITPEELNEVKGVYQLISKLVSQIGEIEARKFYAMHLHKENQDKLTSIRASLQKKYGDVNIDLVTGEINPKVDEAA